jgi:hypothetical protein
LDALLPLLHPEDAGAGRQAQVVAAEGYRVLAPADFGLPTEDDGSWDDSLLGQNLVTCTQ